MELGKRQQLVVDAILLERAARVLARRKHASERLADQLRAESLEYQLHEHAVALRTQGEQG